MTLRATFFLSCAALLSFAAPAAAQNKVETALFLEIRTLQSQVAQLTAAVNAINEHLNKTDAKIEAQANATTKGLADQKVLIDGIATTQRTLSEVQNEGSVRLLQLNQEMKAIREGLGLQQTLLNQILAQLPQPGAAAAATDPNAPPPSGPPSTTRQAAGLPPSPGEYYSAAFNRFYAATTPDMFSDAVEFLSDAIRRFPDSPEAARAQFMIGDAYLAMGGHDKDALAAYALVIKNYTDAEVLPDAYLKQGDANERLGQKEAARKSYEDVRTKFPNSAAKIFAETALRRLGYIK